MDETQIERLEQERRIERVQDGRIMRLPPGRGGARVSIDGEHYADFVDIYHACAAMRLWTELWPGAVGRKLFATAIH